MAFKQIFPSIEKIVEVSSTEKYHIARIDTLGVNGPAYYDLPALGSEIQVFRGTSPQLEFYLAGSLTNPKVTVDAGSGLNAYTVMVKLRK